MSREGANISSAPEGFQRPEAPPPAPPAACPNRAEIEDAIQKAVARWNGDRGTKQTLKAAIYEGIAPFLKQ